MNGTGIIPTFDAKFCATSLVARKSERNTRTLCGHATFTCSTVAEIQPNPVTVATEGGLEWSPSRKLWPAFGKSTQMSAGSRLAATSKSLVDNLGAMRRVAGRRTDRAAHSRDRNGQVKLSVNRYKRKTSWLCDEGQSRNDLASSCIARRRHCLTCDQGDLSLEWCRDLLIHRYTEKHLVAESVEGAVVE